MDKLASSHGPGGVGASVLGAQRQALGREVPELTLDMAMRLLRAALPRPRLSLEEACTLVEYYRKRNASGTTSHRKTRLAKDRELIPKK